MVMHSEAYGNRKIWFSLIQKFKLPFQRMVIQLAKLVPEPSIEKTSNPNTKRLIEAWDWLLENDNNHTKRALWMALKKITCVIYDSENYYALRGNAFLQHLIDSGWEFELPPEKASWWKEIK